MRPGSPTRAAENNESANQSAAADNSAEQASNEDIRSYEEEKTEEFPKLLVSIGSGVSMIKVNEEQTFDSNNIINSLLL